MAAIRETVLPGIGHKSEITTRSREKLVVVIHDDGRRELYYFRADDPDECQGSVTLDDTEARQVAAIIGGLTYQPRTLEVVDIALDNLVIEWFQVTAMSAAAGRTIGQLEVRQQTGASILALIEPDHRQSINPGPEQRIDVGARLVVAGDRQQVRAFRRLLIEGG